MSKRPFSSPRPTLERAAKKKKQVAVVVPVVAVCDSLCDDHWFVVTRHLPEPRDYFALQRVNKQFAALLVTKYFLDDKRVCYYTSYKLWMTGVIHFYAIPDAHLTDALWLHAVRKSPSRIKNMPAHLRTPDFLLALVKLSEGVLAHVPPEMITLEMCTIAAAHSGYELKHVPEVMRTHEVCLAALSNCSDPDEAISYVPVSALTRDVCDRIVGIGCFQPSMLRADMWTPEMCLAVASRHGVWLASVPLALRTHDVCVAAVARSMDAYADVPDEIRETAAFCRIVFHTRIRNYWGD